MTLFTLDGVAYNVRVPAGGLKRSFKVTDGPNATRLLSGDMERDVVGTFYNYTMRIETAHTAPEEYDRLYEELSAPVNFHQLVVPYGQHTLSFTAYVTDGEDNLIRMTSKSKYWTGLTVQFIAKKPQRV